MVGSSAVALQGIHPTGNPPMECSGLRLSFGKVDHQTAGYDANELAFQLGGHGGNPLPSEWPRLHSFSVPARRCAPRVLLPPIPPSRLGNGLLVPGMKRGKRGAQRVALKAMPFPALVVRMVDEFFDAEVHIRQACG